MWLKIMTTTGGAARRTWYARTSVEGRRKEINLNVEIRGTIPRDAKGNFDPYGDGDADFVASRKRAEKAMAEIAKGADKVKSDVQAAKNVYAARTGSSLESVPLTALYDKWIGLIRKRELCETSKSLAKTTFTYFAKFAERFAVDHNVNCSTLDDISPELAKAYYDDVFAQFAWETVKHKWSLVKSAWTRWHVVDIKNPFADVIVQNGKDLTGGMNSDDEDDTVGNEEIGRRPLTEDEIKRLWTATKDDALFHPLAVCAACTGLRIGDACRLRWRAVDLKNGLITIKATAKTGAPVTIPIFDELRDVLEASLADGKDDKYVFPHAADAYENKNTGLIRGIKKYMAEAVEDIKADGAEFVEERPALTVAEALDMIATAGFTEKKAERVRAVLERFKNGMQSARIADELGLARGQVSEYLRDAERVTGETYRPLVAMRDGKVKTVADRVEATRQKRKIGKHSASLYGWHSLRASFVVIAVERGVPVEDIGKIVGHASAQMTLDHYYRPTAKHTAERVRRQMHGRLLEDGGDAHIQTGAVVPVASGERVDVAALLENLTTAQKDELLKRLLATAK